MVFGFSNNDIKNDSIGYIQNAVTTLNIVGAKHGKPSRLGGLVNHRFSSTWSGMDKSVREKQYIYPKSLTLKIGLKKLNKIEVNTICKAITVQGQFLGSSIGLRLSLHPRRMGNCFKFYYFNSITKRCNYWYFIR